MTIPVGVIGVGSMGKHHARVFHELTDAELVGVYDVSEEQAAAVAEKYDTQPRAMGELLDVAEAVSVVVPTPYHHEIGQTVIESGTHALIEKPLAAAPDEGLDLVSAAEDAGVVLQVGHIERFNPAVRAVADFVDDLDILAMQARRLGPPVDDDREVGDGVVLDLMIHDIDVICSLVKDEVADVGGIAAADGDYVDARMQFEDGVVGSLTASRVTQKKVRDLTITAADCQITVDYTDRTVTINRRTRPEYLAQNGDVRYRSEHVVERPTVDNGEPLKKELASFVDTVRTGGEPAVSGPDGLRALRLANRIQDAVTGRE